MEQSPQIVKYKINTPTTQQIFFSTDNNNNFQSSSKDHRFFNKQPDNLHINVQPFIMREKITQPSGIQNNFGPSENNLSKDDRYGKKIDERMRNKYFNNIMVNTVNYNALNYQNNKANIKGSSQNQDRNYQTLEFNDKISKKILDFADPLGYQDHILGRNRKNTNKVEPESKILIEKTLLKPKFGFKSQNSPNQDQTTNSQNDLISFDTSSFTDSKHNGEGMSLNRSKSASNFSDVLRVEEDKINMKMVKNGNFEGYLISKVDKKEEMMAKKLFQIKKNNEIYDQKIKQKQRQIELVRNKMQKQKKELQNYQSKMRKAYDNVIQDTPSLLLNSRNYQQSNPILDKRVEGKARINCMFEGMSKKLCKQVLYGKCMLLQTQLVQIGFDNKNKPGLIELFFIIKQNIMEMQVFLQDVNQNGYILEEDFQMRINNIPGGKKIKAKINVNYVGFVKDRLGFIKLKILIKINVNAVFQQKIILPFLLYRNFFSEINPQQKDGKMVKVKKGQTVNIDKNYKIVTQWQNSCEQLIKNPKNYLDSIFNLKTGKWIEQNIYNIELKTKDYQYKSINILINNRSFAIEMTETKNMDVVTCIGNLLARSKGNIDSKISRFI